MHWVREEGIITKNTTFTIDICKAIGKKKGILDEDQCPEGTRGKLTGKIQRVVVAPRSGLICCLSSMRY